MTFEEMLDSPRHWLLGGLILLAFCFLLSLWTPSDSAEYSICFLRQTTEIPCPGCGLTRGFAALIKFDFWGAVQKHPLSPLFAFEGFLVWVWWGLVAVRKFSLPSPEKINRFLALHAWLLLVVWACRLAEGLLIV